jgi:hypothetical protein
MAQLLVVAIEFTVALRAGHPENFCHGSSQRKKIRNPNIEIRNKRIKLKIRNSKYDIQNKLEVN